MRAIGKQFLGSGRALGVRCAQSDAHLVGHRVARTERPRISIETAAEGGRAELCAFVCAEPCLFVAQADLGLRRAPVERVEREHTDLFGGVLGHERFGANDVEIADRDLHAPCALPDAALALDDLEPSFEALVEERRCDRTVGLDLEMAIVGKACAQADSFEKAVGDIDFAAQIGAILADVETHGFGLDRGIEREADRHAVEAVVVAERDAQIAALAHIGSAAGDFPGARRAVG